MMNELHAGLHVRYLEERQELNECHVCGGETYVKQELTFDGMAIETEEPWCAECGRFTINSVETFEGWAERNDIDLEEL